MCLLFESVFIHAFCDTFCKVVQRDYVTANNKEPGGKRHLSEVLRKATKCLSQTAKDPSKNQKPYHLNLRRLMSYI